MKARRSNGDLMFTGNITGITRKPTGDVLIDVHTHAKNTHYRIILSPSDMAKIKDALFLKGLTVSDVLNMVTWRRV